MPKEGELFSIRELVGLLSRYWQFELFGWLGRSWLMRYLLGLLNFPGTGPFVNRIELLFGATAVCPWRCAWSPFFLFLGRDLQLESPW